VALDDPSSASGAQGARVDDTGRRVAPILRGTPSATRRAAAASSDGGSLAGAVAWARANHGGFGTPAPDDGPIDLRQAQRIADERGYAEGIARAEDELRSAIDAVGSLAVHLEAVAPARTITVSRTIAEVALAVARRIIGAEVNADPALLTHAIETAVGLINGSSEARVILHPAAVEPVRAAWGAAHGSTHLGKRWTFEADHAVAPGACLLRFDHGFVDAGIDAQLTEIEHALDAAIPGLWSGTSLALVESGPEAA
jgi:flagellar assembly protein FliH